MKQSLFSLLLSVCFLYALPSAYSQSYIMSDTLINTCSALFFDSGGSEYGYGINQNITTTICSDDPQNTHIRLSFSNINIGSGESLSVYDADTADPTALMDDTFLQTPHQPFALQASAANTSGCLTIVFTSDDVDGDEAGWGASIVCSRACQHIVSALTTSTPAAMPADTGWIDVCIGQEINFAGHGLYPQNGTFYQHSDASVAFEWIFGDGHTAFGPNVNHTYQTAGGYSVQLKITDQFGCSNINSISQRVRVAPSSSFEIDENLENTFCLGDTIRISASIDSSSIAQLNANSNSASFQQTLNFDEATIIPDGSGLVFSNTININNFPPEAILLSPNDISVHIDLEHSYVGDLSIQLVCPNSNTVFLLERPSGISATNFGEPFVLPPFIDQSSDLTMGLPYTYTFAHTATNGTLAEFNDIAPVYTYETVEGALGESYIHTDNYFPAAEYQSQESFTNLVGCPLNGDWSIIIEDHLGAENGWIAGWHLSFANQLYTYLENIRPTITDFGWEDDPSILNNNPELLEAIPTQTGVANYTFWTTDDFNCLSDTTLQFTVLPLEHPECNGCDSIGVTQENITICEGESYTAPSGTVFSSTGIYQDTIASSIGCDSIRIIDLYVENNELTITQNNDVLEASMGYDGYQWYSQATGIIQGANELTFYPDVSGHYYCEATTPNCTIVSNVINHIVSGTSELAFESLAVYPSLTQGKVHISISDQEHFDNIKLVDLRGIALQEYVSNTRSLDLSSFSAGMYFLVFEGEYKRSVVKVVKL